MIQCNNPGNRDPIINFAKFVIFTFEEYVVVVTQLKQKNEDAIKEKKWSRVQEDELWRERKLWWWRPLKKRPNT
jgi:hypothetical protein